MHCLSVLLKMVRCVLYPLVVAAAFSMAAPMGPVEDAAVAHLVIGDAVNLAAQISTQMQDAGASIAQAQAGLDAVASKWSDLKEEAQADVAQAEAAVSDVQAAKTKADLEANLALNKAKAAAEAVRSKASQIIHGAHASWGTETVALATVDNKAREEGKKHEKPAKEEAATPAGPGDTSPYIPSGPGGSASGAASQYMPGGGASAGGAAAAGTDWQKFIPGGASSPGGGAGGMDWQKYIPSGGDAPGAKLADFPANMDFTKFFPGNYGAKLATPTAGTGGQVPGAEGSPCGTTSFKAFGKCGKGLKCAVAANLPPSARNFVPGTCHKEGATTVTVALVTTNDAWAPDGGFDIGKFDVMPGGAGGAASAARAAGVAAASAVDGGFDINKFDRIPKPSNAKATSAEDWGQYTAPDGTTKSAVVDWKTLVPAGAGEKGAAAWTKMSPGLAMFTSPGAPFDGINIPKIFDDPSGDVVADGAHAAADKADKAANAAKAASSAISAELDAASDSLKAAAAKLRAKATAADKAVRAKAREVAGSAQTKYDEIKAKATAAQATKPKHSSATTTVMVAKDLGSEDAGSEGAETRTGAGAWLAALAAAATVMGGVYVAHARRSRNRGYEEIESGVVLM